MTDRDYTTDPLMNCEIRVLMDTYALQKPTALSNHQRHLLAALQELLKQRMSEWKPINSVPRDRYVLLFCPDDPDWAGNMDVGKWFGDDEPTGCFWSSGGPNGGLELERNWTHWMELPQPPPTHA
jgi:hypothetical protein